MTPRPKLLNSLVDVSADFDQVDHEYFLADRLTRYDPATGLGELAWLRHGRFLDWAFNKIGLRFKPLGGKELPQEDYPVDPVLRFRLSFAGPRTARLRFWSAPLEEPAGPSPMLVAAGAGDSSWQVTAEGARTVWIGPGGRVTVTPDPFQVAFHDPAGRLLTRTCHHTDPKATHSKTPPLLFLRRASDYSRSFAAAFTAPHGERICGCGESYTKLDKRGQKVSLYCTDVQSAATREMHKPVPFFLSSRGYGMFVHSTAPMTFDFGATYAGANTLYVGDEFLDLFFFFGSPAEILAAYTELTGRSPVPPPWSFGLWMSRLSYQSEAEVREVARRLREHRVPCDVVHVDAGWFAHGWRCDYRFSPATFPDPARLAADLRAQGFRLSVWQLPYYSPPNPLHQEVVERDLCVRGPKGTVPTEDVILDFSNPAAVRWYEEKLRPLFKLGVACVKADFGEAAPLDGLFASGRTGFYEHNLYPLRYNRIVAELTARETGERIIWARRAWAGSQRYPVHWSGDPESTDAGMAGTLRAGLSLGLCGFTFWSHDIGGFTGPPEPELYLRWLAFGAFTSHSRCHGLPPKEPWAFGPEFLESFRRIIGVKYRLLPYVLAQSAAAAAAGQPLLRPLLLDYPDDPTAWTVEDQYLFGTDLLVAPLFEPRAAGRRVYLPEGTWIDYQSGAAHRGGRWADAGTAEIPVVVLVRDGAVIPHVDLALSTRFIDWDSLRLEAFTAGGETARGLWADPADGRLGLLQAVRREGRWALRDRPAGLPAGLEPEPGQGLCRPGWSER